MQEAFVLGVIGDFSGGGDPDPARLHEVDRDEFETVFARLAPQLAPEVPFCEHLALRAWDDWRPEGLAARVPGFASLLAARDAVEDPARARTLLVEAGVALPDAGETAAPERPPAPAPPEAGLLDDILAAGGTGDGPAAAPARRPAADPAFERLLEEIAAPHAVRIDHERARAWRDAIDAEIGARLRALLRDPGLRRREASWRSLRTLVWGTETGEDLRIRVLDLPARALDAPAEEGALRRLVVEQAHGTPGGEPFGLLLADFAFGSDARDLARLAHLAQIAQAAGVPCLAGASAALWRDDGEAGAAGSFLERARALPGADRVGLCAPRALVREPYGAAADPVEGFAFEEVDEGTGDEGYVWGNAAYPVARAVLEACATTGSPADAPRFARRESLPFHPRGRGHEPVGPTEQVLSDRELERLRDAGLIPLAGVRGQDTAVVLAFQGLTGAPLWR